MTWDFKVKNKNSQIDTEKSLTSAEKSSEHNENSYQLPRWRVVSEKTTCCKIDFLGNWKLAKSTAFFSWNQNFENESQDTLDLKSILNIKIFHS